jgi:hypothetical protein
LNMLVTLNAMVIRAKTPNTKNVKRLLPYSMGIRWCAAMFMDVGKRCQ